MIRLSESQRRYALLRAVPNSSPRWKRRLFFGFFVIDATSCGATYSRRSNAIGSIFVARNAGKKQASKAIPIK